MDRAFCILSSSLTAVAYQFEAVAHTGFSEDVTDVRLYRG